MAVSRLSQQSLISAFPKGNSIWDGNTSVGSMDAISSIIVPSGGLASIQFSNIPQTYTHLQMRGIFKNTQNTNYDNQSGIRFNNDNGNNYAAHTMYGNGSGFSYLGGGPSGAIYTYATAESGQSSYSAFVLDIYDYTNTSKFKTSRNFLGFDSSSAAANSIMINGGLWMSTNAITAINYFPTAGVWAQHCSFSLYGIK